MSWLLAAFLLLTLAGAGTMIAGIYLVAGTGWALIVLGLSLLAFAEIPRRAMINE